MKLTKQLACFIVFAMLIAIILPPSQQVFAKESSITILASDFENGTTQGWAPKGNESLIVSGDDYHSGSHSLYISGRSEDWEGPNYVLTELLAPNRTYSISAWVKLSPGTTPADIKLTMKSSIDGKDNWEQIGTADQNAASQWTLIKRNYTTGSKKGEYNLYAEATAGTAFYFDDVSVELVPDSEGPVGDDRLLIDFEDGTLQGWLPRIGHEELTVSAAEAYSGSKSMLVEGRSRTFHGPALELKNHLQKNKEYELKAYVRLKEEPASDIKLQMTAYKKSGAESWNALDSITIKKSEWQQWYELKGQLNYSDSPSELKLFIETPYITENTPDTLSFYVDEVTVVPVTALSIQNDIVSLKDYFKNDFPIGAAVYTWQMEGTYGELLKKHFNSITATYEMKPKFISPAENQYTFDAADYYVKYAQDNGMGLRGHALLWHIDAAEWMFTDSNGQPASRDLLLQRLQSYIETVMDRYKGKIYAWDVVNEAIADNGGDADGVRISPWYTLIGPDYIEKAFEFARAADPDAKLYYNDYFTEVPEKREHIYQLLKRLKAKGLIDGVGLQSHYGLITPPIEEVEKTIKLFSSLGLDIQVTELDVDSGVSMGTPMPADIAAKQAHRYKELFDLYKAYKDKISSVTIWGLQDEKSYNNQAMLFDANLQAKLVYWGIVDPLSLPIITSQAVSLMATPTAGDQNSTDSVWNKAVQTRLKRNSSEAATFRTLWDMTNLYVQVEVKDATRDAADKIELFVDENNGKSAIYESDDRHLTFNRSGAENGDSSYKIKETATGYKLEAVIPWKGLAQGTEEIGFDIRIQDASTSEMLPVYWNDSTLSQDLDTSKYGVIQLASMPKSAQSIKGTARIDGQMESEWEKAKPFAVELTNNNSKATAQARSMWTDDSLLLFIDVTDPLLKSDDPQPWLQDSIEIFIDENHQRTSTYQYDDAQYRINIDNVATFAGNASPSRLESAVVRTEKGYRMEVKIALPELRPNTDSVIGLDIQVNDDQGEGVHSTAKWNDPTNDSWRNTSQFGILTFAESEKNSGIDNGGDKPGTSGQSGSTADPVMTITQDNFQNGSPNQVSISVPEGKHQVRLPLQLAGLLKGRELELVKGSATLTIDSKVLQPLIDQLKPELRNGAELSLRMEPVKEATGSQQLKGEQGLSAKFISGESWSFELSLITGDGREMKAGTFDGAVTLSFSYSAEANLQKSLLGIYMLNEQTNKWEYVGGKNDEKANQISVDLAHFSKYALLEYDKSFNDVNSSHWVYEPLKVLSAKQIVNGQTAALFAPDKSITRAEFTVLLVRLLGLKEQGASSFKDAAEGTWFSSAVNAAFNAGIVKGVSADRFAPLTNITREEMAVMLANAYAYQAKTKPEEINVELVYVDKANISAWAENAVSIVSSHGMMKGKGDHRFVPSEHTTRAESVQAIYNLLNILNSSK